MRNSRLGRTPRRGNGDSSETLLTGEAGLWTAVLLRAESDLIGLGMSVNNGNEKANPRFKIILHRRALAWILSDVDGVGSFVFCCHAANTHPEAVREAFLKNSGISDAA